jgi:osmotically-inducible protein OsmY
MIGAMLAIAIAGYAAGASAQTRAVAPAGAIALKVAGPAAPHRNRPDTSIIRDVRRAFRRVPQLDDSEIHIRSSLGIVTLTGSVPQTWQISRAGNAARSVHGVRAVTNRLTSAEGDPTAAH